MLLFYFNLQMMILTYSPINQCQWPVSYNASQNAQQAANVKSLVDKKIRRYWWPEKTYLMYRITFQQTLEQCMWYLGSFLSLMASLFYRLFFPNNNEFFPPVSLNNWYYFHMFKKVFWAKSDLPIARGGLHKPLEIRIYVSKPITFV